jgi:hypothetical protein
MSRITHATRANPFATLASFVVVIALGVPTSVYVSAAPGESFAPTVVDEVLWEIELDQSVAELDAAGDRVIARTADSVVALDSDTGERVWRHEVSGGEMVHVGVSPDGSSAVVSVTSSGAVTFVGLDVSSGRERFTVDAPLLMSPDEPDGQPSVADETFVFPAPDGRLIAYSLQTGDPAWESQLPDDCSQFVRWWGSDQVAGAGVLVACGTVTADAVGWTGGYVAFDGSTGAVMWSVVRSGHIGDAWHPPDVSPDGALALLFLFGEGAMASYGPREGLIVDTSTGDDVARGTFVGELAYDGWFAHRGLADRDFRFERLGSDDVVIVEPPCGCSSPVAVLPAGVLWTGRDRESHEPVFQYSPMDGSPVVVFPPPAEFGTSVDPAVTPRAVVLAGYDSPHVVAVG